MRAFLKRLHSFFALPSRGFGVVRVEGHAEAKLATKKGNVLVLVGAPAKWAYVACPCGCGQDLALNLMRSHRPHWELRLDKGGRPSLTPSISSIICGAHFWLRDGAINWAEPPPTAFRETGL